MPLYRRKPTTVDAEQFVDFDMPPRGVEFHGTLALNQHTVTTMQGRTVAVEPGEWIVAESDGAHYYPIADAEFRRIYEPVI